MMWNFPIFRYFGWVLLICYKVLHLNTIQDRPGAGEKHVRTQDTRQTAVLQTLWLTLRPVHSDKIRDEDVWQPTHLPPGGGEGGVCNQRQEQGKEEQSCCLARFWEVPVAVTDHEKSGDDWSENCRIWLQWSLDGIFPSSLHGGL